MNEDRRRILDMLAQGKVSVEEAEQLLEAVTASAPPSGAAAEAGAGAKPEENPAVKKEPRYCYVTVLAPGKDGAMAEKVNVRVPFSLVRSGIKLGAMLPKLVGEKAKDKLSEYGAAVDVLRILDQPEMETILRDLGELTVDVHDSGSQVRVRCE